VSGDPNGKNCVGLFPRHKKELTFSDGQLWNPLQFLWQGQSKHPFQIVIAKDPEFRNIVFESKVPNPNSLVLLEAQPGEYFWRVGCSKGINDPLTWTETYSFELKNGSQRSPSNENKTFEEDKIGNIDF
jgi:hypothetical protein